MAQRTTQQPQERRITRKHGPFCNGSNQAYFHRPQAGCIASMTYLRCHGEEDSADPATADCTGVLTLFVSALVAAGEKAEHRDEAVFVK